VGTRPQYIKLKSFQLASRQLGIDFQYLDTGQHHSTSLSKSILTSLDMPAPLFNLDIGSQHPSEQLSLILNKFKEFLEQAPIQFSHFVVYGDTTSTLGLALTLNKLEKTFSHVESGLRSHDKRMPEEINRILTDHMASLRFAPTDTALSNLRSEGLQDKSHNFGDPVVDVVQHFHANGRFDSLVEEQFILLTLHRPSNVDSPSRLRSLLTALNNFDRQIKFPIHPRVVHKYSLSFFEEFTNIEVIQPLDYLSMLMAIQSSIGVVTDSGGVQREAFLLKVPCTTVRESTEWPETLINECNVLCENPKLLQQTFQREKPVFPENSIFGGSGVALRILEELSRY